MLTGANGTVKRDTWTSDFSEIVATLSSPDSSVVKPIAPQSERIPGAAVHIPDVHLRKNIAEALGKVSDDIITISEMATLKRISGGGPNLEGLQFATNLEWIKIWSTPVTDLSPLSGLTNLRTLICYGIGPWDPFDRIDFILDISPLAGLTELRHLDLHSNRISDISPLAGLTNLHTLDLSGNRISDLSPLETLVKLERLNLANQNYQTHDPTADRLNSLKRFQTLSDISPLAGLRKMYDLDLSGNEISDVSSLSTLVGLRTLKLEGNRISDVSPLANLKNLSVLRIHLNDISDISPLKGLREKIDEFYWHGNPCFPQGGPKIEGPWLWVLVPGANIHKSVDMLSLASEGAITEKKIATHGATEGSRVGENAWTAHKIAPTSITTSGYISGNIEEILKAIDMRDNWSSYGVYGSITFFSPRQQKINMFAGSWSAHKVWLNGKVVRDWQFRGGGFHANDYDDFFPVTLNRGLNVLLVGIYSERHPQNGYFGFQPGTDYTLLHPRLGYTFSKPTIHVGDTFMLDIRAEDFHNLAGWQFDIAFDPAVLEAIELNEGDFLKTGGDTTFFQKGKIDNRSGKITELNSALLSGGGVTGTGTLLSIKFSAKVGGETQLKLQNVQFGASTGSLISAGPHEVTIVVVERLSTGDINRDGQVSILDIIFVAQHLGKTAPPNSEIDINGDGTISILDIILVAQHLGESTAAAPSILAMDDIHGLDPAMIQAWIEQAQVEDDGSIAFQQGITKLQQLLASLIPEETALLPNYPNPFNPETWVPYQLSEPAEVTLRIYTVNGILVRTLALGHMPAGIYQNRSRAVYWDGRNDVDESVASGMYFYTLTAGDFTATRKLLIRK